ncbi:MAG: DinB family protein [Acidobacteria bacterium]|nr:DinB family protein [Acidobacteriota bacterium]
MKTLLQQPDLRKEFPVHAVATKLEKLISETEVRLRAVTESESERRPAPGKWSKKEILGHLVDSASNNHQRFVRAQLGQQMSFPGYAQSLWVEAQGYQTETWENLVRLWTSYNLHLLQVVSRIPPEKLANPCIIGDQEPVTLEFLVRDYVRHLEHHLSQIQD